MKSLLRIMFSAAALFGAGLVPAHAQIEPMAIYGNALAPGWNNWSWADVEIGAQISDPEERPISVRAQGWQALYLQHAAFSTAGYTELTFFVHGGAAGGQTLSVIAVDARGEPIDRFFRVVPEANAWTEVHVPLSEIGASDTSITGFFIQNGTPDPARRFLVNEIALR